MSQMLEDFKKYRDQFGMNQLNTDGTQGGTTDNGALFTMEYLLCLLSHIYDDAGKLDPQIFSEAQDEIQRLKAVYANLEKTPGLSVRYPGSQDFDSMDNQSALLQFSAQFGAHGYAARMRTQGLIAAGETWDGVQDSAQNLKYLKIAKLISTLQLAGFWRAKNFWNNQRPNTFCFAGWYGRSPGMMGWLDLCATGHTSWFRALGLWVAQALLPGFSKKGDTDAWKLSYVIWYSLRHRGWTWRLGYWLWKQKLLKTYPGGMRDVYAQYYSDPNHPIRTYAKAAF